MLPLLAAMGIGAIIGGVVSVGIYAATSEFITHKPLTWGGAGAALAGGVVAGALAPLGGGWIAAGGIKAITALAGIGAASSVVTSAVGSWLDKTAVSVGGLAKSALLGAALGVATFGAGRYFAGMSGSQIQGGIADAEGALAPKLASVVDGAEAALKTTIDADVPAALTPAVDNALDTAAKDLGDVATAQLGNVAADADKAALSLQGDIDAAWKVTPAADAAAPADASAAADAAAPAAADATAPAAADATAAAPADATPATTDAATATKTSLKDAIKARAIHPTTHATIGGGSAAAIANMVLGTNPSAALTTDTTTPDSSTSTTAAAPTTTAATPAATAPNTVVINNPQPGTTVTVTVTTAGTASSPSTTASSAPVAHSAGLVSLVNTIAEDNEGPVKTH
jgi:hypothetical protein